MVFAFGIEFLVVAVPAVTRVLDGISRDALIGQIPVLISGHRRMYALLDLALHPHIRFRDSSG